MSQNSPSDSVQSETLGVESSLEALRSSPAFRGPVEPHEGQNSNDHIALIYETPEEAEKRASGEFREHASSRTFHHMLGQSRGLVNSRHPEWLVRLGSAFLCNL